jgi:hypothetical protein
MKIREVEIEIEAKSDMLEGRAFYDVQSLSIGNYFIESVLADLGALRLYAGIHRRVNGFHRQLCSRFPFAVYYEIVADRVQVAAVLDMRKDPSWIQKSLAKRNPQNRA